MTHALQVLHTLQWHHPGEQLPGTEVYRDKLLDRFGKSDFNTKHSASITAKAQVIHGDHAKVKLEVILNAEPKA